MSARSLTVVLTVEDKDEYQDPESGEWKAGSLPAASAVVSRVQDVLRDVTKHDETLGWRITKVVSGR